MSPLSSISCDVLVVGLGFGAAVCDRLASQGLTVVGIDKHHGIGSTFTNQNWKHSGALYENSKISSLLWRSWRQKSAPEKGSTLCIGSYYISGDEDVFQQHLSTCELVGIDHRALGRAEAGSFSRIREGARWGFESCDAVVDYRRVVEAHIASAVSRGARFLIPGKIEDFMISGGVVKGAVVGLESGQISINCRQTVLACGAWTAEVSKLAGIDLPVVNWVSTILTVKKKLTPRITVFIDEPHMTLVPVGDVTLVSNADRVLARGPYDRRSSSQSEIESFLERIRPAFPIVGTLERQSLDMRRCIKTTVERPGVATVGTFSPCFLGTEHLPVEGIVVALPGKASLFWQGAQWVARRVAGSLGLPTAVAERCIARRDLSIDASSIQDGGVSSSPSSKT